MRRALEEECSVCKTKQPHHGSFVNTYSPKYREVFQEGRGDLLQSVYGRAGLMKRTCV